MRRSALNLPRSASDARDNHRVLGTRSSLPLQPLTQARPQSKGNIARMNSVRLEVSLLCHPPSTDPPCIGAGVNVTRIGSRGDAGRFPLEIWTDTNDPRDRREAAWIDPNKRGSVEYGRLWRLALAKARRTWCVVSKAQPRHRHECLDPTKNRLERSPPVSKEVRLFRKEFLVPSNYFLLSHRTVERGQSCQEAFSWTGGLPGGISSDETRRYTS